MEFVMDQTTELTELQRRFNEEFNFLKLEFYGLGSKMQWIGKIPAFKGAILKDGEGNNKRPDKRIEIDKKQTVAEVEAYLLKILGIKVSVLRKSGNLWIETRHSSTWSLEKQNQVGSELSNTKQGDKDLH